MYAERLRDQGRTEEVRDFFENLLRTRTSNCYEAYLFLLEYYEKRKDNAMVYVYLNMFFESFYKSPQAFVANSNFRPDVVIGLFGLLSKVENEPAKLERIQKMIEGLRDLKIGVQK